MTKLRRIPRGIKPNYNHPLMDRCVYMGLLQEGQGGLIEDYSYSKNNGQATNFDLTSSWQNTLFGRSLNFNASDRHVALSKYHWYDQPTEYSVSQWIIPSSIAAGTRYINQFANTGGSGHAFFNFYMSTAKIVFLATDGATFPFIETSAGYAAVGSLYHVVGVRQGGNMYLYINGALYGSTTNTLGTITITQNPLIGIGPTSLNGDFLGNISDVRVWKKALTAFDVKHLYENPFEVFDRRPAPMFAFGDTGGGGGSLVKNRNGLAVASISNLNALAMASVKNINGLTNV